ncbi:double-stranded RNA-specific editase 1-like [Chironomus tepperi]|uniref:double-stranded RNA-specific editase 1-like n=1 Tax=Chironomus tepperi TaxID=113505 RepID=UPI00391FA570
MHRQHYRNNFIQGETTFQNQQRNTRSNNAQVQPAAAPSPAVIPIKTEPAPPQQPAPQVVQQPVAVVQQPAATPMKVDPPTKAADISLSEDDLMKLKKINFKKKVTGKEKRLKQNKKLFRMLTPRNAIAALNELHGQSINETTVVPVPGNKFEAEIVINNVKFQGTGNSKMAAKNSACEKALRDLVINKFKQVKHTDPIQLPITEDVNMEEGSDTSGDVPMLQLASFALHKLFSEWESEGFEIPFPKVNPEVAPPTSTPPNGVEPKSSPKTPKVRNELPPNNLQMHPVMLLSVMRPCTQYSDLGSQGVTPNILHTVGCTVDGQSFIGQGRSKKEARKRVATEILMKLFEWKGSCC